MSKTFRQGIGCLFCLFMYAIAFVFIHLFVKEATNWIRIAGFLVVGIVLIFIWKKLIEWLEDRGIPILQTDAVMADVDVPLTRDHAGSLQTIDSAYSIAISTAHVEPCSVDVSADCN